ncbi:hypothetical protein NHQ30_005332 [Ciborinia camelliae]|nr:hypothetical protein NHQ30_005332 [Ciborinia camelliae]
MASPNTSTTRRVLGNIDININTSALDIYHETSVAKVQTGLFGDSLKFSAVEGNSTAEIQRENSEETDTILQVARLPEAKMELEMGPEDASEAAILECLSNAGPAQLAGKKRCFLHTEDARDITLFQARSCKKNTSGTQHLSDNSSADGGKSAISPQTGNRIQYSIKTRHDGGWKEDFPHDDSHAREHDRGFMASISPHQPQIKPSSFISSSFSSIGDAEDTAVAANNSQASTITIPDELPFIPTTVSTTRSICTSKSKSLSREEIRRKSQALRLRLSLANYKVKTNQIDLPLSRLEVRSTSSKLPSLARLRANPSYGASMGNRTPLPGAPPMSAGEKRVLVPAINLQRPSSSGRSECVFVREERERESEKDQDGDVDVGVDIPSSPPLSRSDSSSRRDSAISCTSFGSNSHSNSGSGHAHPLTPIEKNKNMEIHNMEKEVARRKQEMLRGMEKENMLPVPRKPILESQKLGIANPPMVFVQPEMDVGMDMGIGRGERGRSPELSRRAADGLVRLSLLR